MRGEERVVTLVVGPGVREARFEGIAGVGANSWRGILREACYLPPDARVA